MQVRIDWDNINAKVEAEYKQEKERPSAVAPQVDVDTSAIPSFEQHVFLIEYNFLS